MRNIFLIVALLISKFMMSAIVFDVIYSVDTLPPPPAAPITISGDTNTCVNDTNIYTADIPLGCQANWYIDGILQGSTAGELEVVWDESGIFLISLEMECDTTIFPSSTLEVVVGDIPATPTSIQGVTDVCTQSTEIYTTEVADDEHCQWTVDGIIQMSTTTTLSYYWDELGLHTIEVRAVNDCGMGEATYLDVTVVSLPVVNLGNDTTLQQGQTIELDAGNPGSTYLWSTGETTQTIIVSQPGDYEVVVDNPCGDDWDEITVDVVVSVDEFASSDELVTIITGSFVSVLVPDTYIEKVQIWDISGRLIVNSTAKPFYYLPEKGIYFVIAFAEGGNVFKCRIVN